MTDEFRKGMLKGLFVVALACAGASLLAIVAWFLITIVPGPGAESWRIESMALDGVLAAAWLGIAFWARRPLGKSPPPWLTWLLTMVGFIYLLYIIFGFFA
ncbi:MAG TPA: hypothetical protein VG733_06905 [Chthoniobacteraceae bacterium]|nr:hypothetical protein [Chthoniobacteraceae bacterium]